MKNWLLAFAAVLSGSGVVAADEPTVGRRHVLILCGHPGDEDFAKEFSTVVTRLSAAATQRLGVAADCLQVLWGPNAEADTVLEGVTITGTGTREGLERAAVQLVAPLDVDDALWVFVVGHAYFDGRVSWLNLHGPDVSMEDFGQLFRNVACREQVFFVTTSASGYAIKPLSRAGRQVMTATEADVEVNATLFPQALADVLSPTDESAGLVDADNDGTATMLDVYLATARRVAAMYTAENLLSTEHALLDDNGDGRGTELQRDYLSEAEGGRKRRQPPIKPQAGRDGSLAAGLVLPYALAVPMPMTEPPIAVP